jgi:hypothetical protein
MRSPGGADTLTVENDNFDGGLSGGRLARRRTVKEVTAWCVEYLLSMKLGLYWA